MALAGRYIGSDLHINFNDNEKDIAMRFLTSFPTYSVGYRFTKVVRLSSASHLYVIFDCMY